MSKCEHGQKITTFCATECCVWREAGGCPACIKKYHNHMGPTVFIGQEEANKLVKKYNVQQTAKHKCRSLQEGIFNYFNAIKSQFDAFIDSACIDTMNQIGHPYLAQTNMLTTYKRLKKKEYRKIQQKDFRNFYQATQKLNEKQLYEKEAKIYLQKVKKKTDFINAIERAIRAVEKANKDFEESYFSNHDGSLNMRINDIVKSIVKNSEKNDESASKKENQSSAIASKIEKFEKNHTRKPSVFIQDNTESIQSQKIRMKTDQSTKKDKQEDNQVEKKREQKQKEKQKARPGRLSSLDKQFIKSNKLHTSKITEQQSNDVSINWKVNHQKLIEPDKSHEGDKKSPIKRYFDTKQVQINEKKQKLIDMMKNKEENSANRLKPYFQIKSIDKSQNKISDKSASGLQVQGSGDSLEGKDQNSHFFAHTALPRTQSRKKIFEEAEQVAQKTVFIPVDVHHKIQPSKIEECQSPLIKNKFKSNEYPKKAEHTKQNFDLMPVKVKSKEELMNEIELDDKKEKSLALLIKSLNLRVEEAIPYLEKSLYYADDNLSAAEYLSYLYLEIDRPKDCLTICNQMLEKLVNSPNKIEMSLHLSINKAVALNMLGRYSESIVVLEQYLKGKPHEKVYKNLGDAYYSIGIYEKASYYYQKAVSKSDNYDQAHYNLAVCLFIQQNYYNAKFSIMKALHASPKNETYKQLLKQIQLRIKQY